MENEVEIESIEVCPSCGSRYFAIARDIIGTRHCKCGNTWAPFFKSRIVYTFQVIFLCLGCNNRWLAIIGKNHDLTTDECPKCGLKKSFPSFIPDNFYSEF